MMENMERTYRRRETKLPYVHYSAVVFSDLRLPDMPRRGVFGCAHFRSGTSGGHLGRCDPCRYLGAPNSCHFCAMVAQNCHISSLFLQ